MNRMRSLLKNVARWGALATVALAPTQFGIAVAGRATLSVVDPLIWLAWSAWLGYTALTPCESETGGRLPASGRRSVLLRRLRALPCPPLLHVLLAVLAVGSVCHAVSRFLAMKDAFQWIEYFLVAYLLFTVALTTFFQARVLVWLALGSASLCLAAGMLQYVSPAVPDFAVRATFNNRNVFGGYLAMILPLTFGLLLFDRHRARRIWYGLLLLAGWSVMLAGGSFLASFLACALMVFVARGSRAFALFSVVALCWAAVAGGGLPRDNPTVLHRSVMLCDAQDESRIAQRYAEWQAALFMIGEHPWRGVGLGNYQRWIGQYYGALPDATQAAEPDSQNLYLVVAATLGLPGLLVWLGVLLRGLTLAMQGYARARDALSRGLALGVFGALLAFCVNSVWSPLLVRGLGVNLILLLALARALASAGNRE
jgi:putative inorganic carbon (hco3(-)) transporter